MFHRTSTVELLRPLVSVDTYGDEAEEWDVTRTGIGAHIAETAQRAFSAVENRWTVARGIRALLDPDVDLALGDRLRDPCSGHVYTVVHIYDHDESPIGIIPTRVDLERVTG